MLKRRAVDAVGWSAVEQFGAQGITVVFTLVLARLLTPEDFGIFASALLVSSFVKTIGMLGLDRVIVQRKELVDENVNTAFWMALAAATVLTVATILMAPFVAAVFGDARIALVLSIVAVTITMSAINGVVTGVMRRELRMKVLAKRTLAANIIAGGIAVPLALADYGVFALVTQHVLGSVLSLAFILALGRFRIRFTFDKSAAKEMLQFGSPLVTADVITHYNRESPKLFVGLFLGIEALGVMTVALRVMNLLISLVGTSLTKTALPILSHINRSTDRLNEIYLRLVHLAVSFIVPCFFMVIVLREPLVDILLGTQWQPAAPIIGILSAAGILTALNFLNGTTLVAIGQPGARLWFAILRAVVGTALLAAAAPIGLVAAASALLLRGVLVEPMQLAYLLRQLGLGPRVYLAHMRSALIGGAVLLITGLGAMALTAGLSSLLIAAIVGSVMGISYFLCVWIADPVLRAEIAGFISVRRGA